VSGNTGGRARGPLSLDSPNNASEATRLHSSFYSRLGRVKLQKTEGRIIRGRLWAQNEKSPILVENHKRDGKGLRECPERWSCGVCDRQLLHRRDRMATPASLLHRRHFYGF
jgi:hypothetical protein